jgi:hypothetical protein
VLSISVRTEPSAADPAVATEQAGDASARAGSCGTAAPLAPTPGDAVADEPARPDVQPAQTTTPAARSTAKPIQPSARDLAAQTFMP